MNKFYIWIGLGIVVIGAFLLLSNKSEKISTPTPQNAEEVKGVAVEFPTQDVQQEATKSVDKTPTKSMNKVPEMQIVKTKKYQAVLHTTKGDITIDLYADKTPITVNNFVSLARNKFYDNTIFHRVIKGFMIQGGDPEGTGAGGPGYSFEDEPFSGEYTRGTIAMANAGPNTNGSQFFIMHADYALPKNYVIFGKVASGLDVVDVIAEAPVTRSAMGENSKPVTPVNVTSIDIIEK